MSQLSNSLNSTPAAWRVVLTTTLSNAWDSVFMALMVGIIFSMPETGEPSGWRFGLFMGACCLVGGGLGGFCIGLWRVCRPAEALLTAVNES
jgi:hypothetical protein